MMLFKNAAEVLAAVRDARDAALDSARKDCGPRGVFKSRGMEFVWVDAKGKRLDESGAWMWDGSAKDLKASVASISERFPEVAGIFLEGGFDWAESVRAMADCDYDPWVSDWSVEIWKKEA